MGCRKSMDIMAMRIARMERLARTSTQLLLPADRHCTQQYLRRSLNWLLDQVRRSCVTRTANALAIQTRAELSAFEMFLLRDLRGYTTRNLLDICRPGLLAPAEHRQPKAYKSVNPSSKTSTRPHLCNPPSQAPRLCPTPLPP